MENQVFDYSVRVSGSKLSYEDSLNFEVYVEDTIAQYNVYINLRHKSSYPYSNMWVKLKTKTPDGKIQDKDLSLPLADDAGKWYGTSVSDIVDQKLLIQSKAILSQKGIYNFTIYQNSRDSILEGILDMGWRMERISQK